jgi:hypothetical protein
MYDESSSSARLGLEGAHQAVDEPELHHGFSLRGSWSGAASVHAEPFEALALRLELLWKR